jgi:hypothetical protein
VSEQCLLCPAPTGNDVAFSLEGDDGGELLSCAAHLAELVTQMFDRRLASGELKVYDVRPR